MAGLAGDGWNQPKPLQHQVPWVCWLDEYFDMTRWAAVHGTAGTGFYRATLRAMCATL